MSPQLHWHLGLRRSSRRPPSRLPPPAASSAWHGSPFASQPGSAPCRPPRRGTGAPPCHLPWHHRCPACPAGAAVPLLPPTSCTPEPGALPGSWSRARQSRQHSGLSPVPLNEASLAGSSCSQPCTLRWAALPSLRAPLPVWSGPGAAPGARQNTTFPQSPLFPCLSIPSPTRAFLPLCPSSTQQLGPACPTPTLGIQGLQGRGMTLLGERGTGTRLSAGTSPALCHATSLNVILLVTSWALHGNPYKVTALRGTIWLAEGLCHDPFTAQAPHNLPAHPSASTGWDPGGALCPREGQAEGAPQPGSGCPSCSQPCVPTGECGQGASQA